MCAGTRQVCPRMQMDLFIVIIDVRRFAFLASRTVTTLWVTASARGWPCFLPLPTRPHSLGWAALHSVGPFWMIPQYYSRACLTSKSFWESTEHHGFPGWQVRMCKYIQNVAQTFPHFTALPEALCAPQKTSRLLRVWTHRRSDNCNFPDLFVFFTFLYFPVVSFWYFLFPLKKREEKQRAKVLSWPWVSCHPTGITAHRICYVEPGRASGDLHTQSEGRGDPGRLHAAELRTNFIMNIHYESEEIIWN